MNLKREMLFLLLSMGTCIHTGPYCHISNDFDEVLSTTDTCASSDDTGQDFFEEFSEDLLDLTLTDTVESEFPQQKQTTFFDGLTFQMKKLVCLCAVRWHYTQEWVKEKIKTFAATLQIASVQGGEHKA